MEEFESRLHFVIAGKHQKPITADLWYQAGSEKFPVIIFAHGFKGFKNWGPFDIMAKKFARAGFNFLKFNFAYNGTTPDDPYNFSDLDAFGENNFTKELDDLEAVIDWVQQHNVQYNIDPGRIFLTGHSRGGATCIVKAGEDERVSAVAAWASVAEFTRHISEAEVKKWEQEGVHYVENTRTGQMMPLHFQLYRDFMQHHRRLNVLNAVHHLKVPLLLIHGTDDETVPFMHAVELFNENPVKATLLEIKGASHTFGAVHPHEVDNLPPDFEIAVNETILFFHSR